MIFQVLKTCQACCTGWDDSITCFLSHTHYLVSHLARFAIIEYVFLSATTDQSNELVGKFHAVFVSYLIKMEFFGLLYLYLDYYR